jgi:hypothetical protein
MKRPDISIIIFLQFLLLIIGLSTLTAQGIISVNGVFNTDTTWCADTVKVTGDVTVNDTLTICPGTYIEFQGHFSISAGVILAIGSANDSITFTIRDTTGFHNPEITNGGWNGLIISDSCRYAFCKFHFGKILSFNSALIKNSSNLNYESTPINISNSSIRWNYAINGLIYSTYGHESINIDSTAIEQNIYNSFLYCYPNRIFINNCVFRHNVGSEFFKPTSITVNNSIFCENKGLGILAGESSISTIKNCIFENNFDLTLGHLSSQYGTVVFNYNRLINNANVKFNLDLVSESSQFLGNVLYKNQIETIKLWVLASIDTPLCIANNTFYDNQIVNDGPLIAGYYNFINNILYYDYTVNSKGILLAGKDAQPFIGDIKNCDIKGGISAVYKPMIGELKGIFDADPNLTDPENGDYSLSENSHCIDLGDSSIVVSFISGIDLESNKRIRGSNIDLGALEFQGSPANRPPIMYSVREMHIIPNSLKIVSIKIFDPDPGDHFTLSQLSSTVPELKIHDISTSADSLHFIVEPDSNWAGSGQVQIQVIDDNGNTASDEFHVEVSNVFCGELLENTVWSGDTIKVDCDIVVPKGITLTIKPGTVVTFNKNCGLVIYGSIIAIADESSRISFTCSDTTGFSTNNYSGWGGIRLMGHGAGDFLFCNISFAKSEAQGGAIYHEGSQLRVIGCNFYYNSSQSNGGAIAIWGPAVIKNNIFYNNRSNGWGGAIFYYFPNCIISNSLFFNNYAHYAGAIYASTENGLLNNNTVVENIAEISASAIYFEGIKSNINCIIWGNESISGQDQIIIYGGECNFYNSLIQGGIDHITNAQYIEEYENNIDADPLFKDTANYDFHLTYNSPCINAGTTDTTGLHLPATDLNGNPRIADLYIDMGAYEYSSYALQLLLQPEGLSACIREDKELSVNASGGITGYQWQKEGMDIPGETSRFVHFVSIDTSQAGNYNCKIFTADSIVSTDTVIVAVDIPATIVGYTESFGACERTDTLLALQAGGTNIISYSWLKDSSMIEDEILPVIELPFIQTSDEGIYRGIAQNVCGSDTTVEIFVRVFPLPQFYLGNDTTIHTTDTLLLNAGEGFESYSWNTGADENSLLIIPTQPGEYEYWIAVTDSNSCSSGDTILLTVEQGIAAPELSMDFNIKVYPNPTSGLVYLVTEATIENVTISLVDVEGRLIHRENLKHIEQGVAYSIDLSAMLNGFYLLMINNNSVRILKK